MEQNQRQEDDSYSDGHYYEGTSPERKQSGNSFREQQDSRDTYRNRSEDKVNNRYNDESSYNSDVRYESNSRESHNRQRNRQENFNESNSQELPQRSQHKLNDSRRSNEFATDGRLYTNDGYYNTSYRQRSGSLGQKGRFISRSWSVEGPHKGKGPKGYKRSDERIVEDASDALQQCGSVDATEIEVTCDSGVLTLKGTVVDRNMKRQAEDCVEEVNGVNDVMNQLSVKKGMLESISDWFSDEENEAKSS